MVPTDAATNPVARAPTTGPGSGSSGCTDTIWHLLPPEANVSQVSRFYGKADERIRKVFADVSTSGAYTIFLSIDAVFSYTGEIPAWESFEVASFTGLRAFAWPGPPFSRPYQVQRSLPGMWQTFCIICWECLSVQFCEAAQGDDMTLGKFAGSPNDPVSVIQRMSDSAFTSWLLYNMLPTPMPVDQIGLARRLPTLLTRATGLDVYDLRSSLPANFAFGGRVSHP